MSLEEQVAAVFADDGRVLAAYLLGSAASGRLRPDSDIDLALMPMAELKLGNAAFIEGASSLAYQLGREVDIGVLSSDNLVYAYQALMTGKRVFVRDTLKADMRATTLMGIYLRFNHDRSGVLRAYQL